MKSIRIVILYLNTCTPYASIVLNKLSEIDGVLKNHDIIIFGKTVIKSNILIYRRRSFFF